MSDKVVAKALFGNTPPQQFSKTQTSESSLRTPIKPLFTSTPAQIINKQDKVEPSLIFQNVEVRHRLEVQISDLQLNYSQYSQTEQDFIEAVYQLKYINTNCLSYKECVDFGNCEQQQFSQLSQDILQMSTDAIFLKAQQNITKMVSLVDKTSKSWTNQTLYAGINDVQALSLEINKNLPNLEQLKTISLYKATTLDNLISKLRTQLIVMAYLMDWFKSNSVLHNANECQKTLTERLSSVSITVIALQQGKLQISTLAKQIDHLITITNNAILNMVPSWCIQMASADRSNRKNLADQLLNLLKI